MIGRKGKTLRAHILQHVPFEGPGAIAAWLKTTGADQAYTRFYQATVLPRIEEFDLLVVMGGPMSVNDEQEYPWLLIEKQFIREAIQAGKAVLGICLGAQLIASAMGAGVYRNSQKEIGWLPVQGVAAEDDAAFRFPSSLEVFHWHGETFDLPSGAVQLARSEGCENQAFQFGSSVIGLQFHLETMPQLAWELVNNCRSELLPAKYVQTEEEILSAGRQRYRSMHVWLDQILSFLTREEGETV